MSKCVEWTGRRNKGGYGFLSVNKQAKLAHRHAWELANKACLLRGAVIMHTCDNPPCCNPDHLRLGSNSENAKDMWRKGRARKGAPRRKDGRPVGQKYAEHEFDAAFRRWQAGERIADIAEAMHCARVTLSRAFATRRKAAGQPNRRNRVKAQFNAP